jgi:hypothetical protein
MRKTSSAGVARLYDLDYLKIYSGEPDSVPTNAGTGTRNSIHSHLDFGILSAVI